MRILDLFSGTHSVGKVARALGHEVLSLAEIFHRALGYGPNHLQPTSTSWRSPYGLL